MDIQLIVGKREIAKALGLSEGTILRLCQRGEIPAFKLGSQWALRPDGFADFAKRRETEATAGAAP